MGNLTGHTPAFGTVPHFANVIGHSLVGCLMASAGGSTCGSGAAAGAVPAFAGPLINDESFSVRSLVLNTTLGGLGSVAGGGKFANGAVTGAFDYLFNAAMGRFIGGQIGAWGAGALGIELGPLDVVVIAVGRWAGGAAGSAIEDWLFNNDAKDATTLKPGPHAGDSIPARGPERDFTPEEREKINEIGKETGCHTCGSKDPGTKSGDFVPDHQPPSALNPDGTPQRLYPHCLHYSKVQGGEVRGATMP